MSTVWKDACRLFGKVWVKIAVIALCVCGVYAALMVPVVISLVGHGGMSVQTGDPLQWVGAWYELLFQVCLFLVGIFAGRWMLDICFCALHNKQANVWQSFNYVLKRIHWLLLYGLLVGVALFFGFLCLIVPGLALAIMLPYGYFFILYDQTGVIEAFGRALKLVWGRWWHTFFTLFVPFVAVYFVLVFVIAGVVVVSGNFDVLSFLHDDHAMVFVKVAVFMWAIMCLLIGPMYCLMSCVFQNLLAFRASLKS
jgi:hypothetical protein